MKYLFLLLWATACLVLVAVDIVIYFLALLWHLKYKSWHNWVNTWAKVDSCNDKNPFHTLVRYYLNEFMKDPVNDGK